MVDNSSSKTKLQQNKKKTPEKKQSTNSVAMKVIIIIFAIASIPFILFNPDISFGPLDVLRRGLFSSEILMKQGKISSDGLAKAISDNDLGLVKLYVRSGTDLNKLDSKGVSPLCHALKLGNMDIVNFMLKGEINVFQENFSDGLTPVFCAIHSGNTKTYDALKEVGVEFNSRNDKVDGMSPLHYAAMLGKDGFVSYLVDYGAVINLHDSNGRTPLHYAAQQDNIVVMHILLNAGADANLQDDDYMTPLDYAVQTGHEDYIQLLQNHGAIPKNIDAEDYNEQQNTPQ